MSARQTKLANLRRLGYTVELAQELATGRVFRVRGPGVDTMVDERDTAAWRSLADLEAHRERTVQALRSEAEPEAQDETVPGLPDV